jgi:hypothetical protein
MHTTKVHKSQFSIEKLEETKLVKVYTSNNLMKRPKLSKRRKRTHKINTGKPVKRTRKRFKTRRMKLERRLKSQHYDKPEMLFGKSIQFKNFNRNDKTNIMNYQPLFKNQNRMKCTKNMELTMRDVRMIDRVPGSS